MFVLKKAMGGVMMNVKMWSYATLMAWFALLGFHSQDADADALPNIVVILTDDQGYHDLGCYGSPNLKTPNIDRLADQGMRFTDFYSAFPVCSASRAGLMTGCYQLRLSMPGVLGPHSPVALHPDEVTIAEILKPEGYATCFVGKWHLGDSPETLPTAQGFDHYYGLPYSNDMARKQGWKNDADALDQIWNQKRWDIYGNQLYNDKEVVESPANQITLTDRYAAEALKFIREHSSRPFYLQLATSMPHVPLFVSEDRYESDPHLAYKATIEHIDAVVGQILETLDQQGVADNTWIIYTSDNGPWLPKKHHAGSALPLRAGKATTYEGGMRVPGIMRWPARIAAGTVCRQVTASVDLLPTIAAVVGSEHSRNGPIDGHDLSALLDDSEYPSPHDEHGFFYCFHNKVSAVRLGKWKLRRGESPELYDLETDIGESNNLAEKRPDQAAKLEMLASEYEADLRANARPPWRKHDPAAASPPSGAERISSTEASRP